MFNTPYGKEIMNDKLKLFDKLYKYKVKNHQVPNPDIKVGEINEIRDARDLGRNSVKIYNSMFKNNSEGGNINFSDITPLVGLSKKKNCKCIRIDDNKKSNCKIYNMKGKGETGGKKVKPVILLAKGETAGKKKVGKGITGGQKVVAKGITGGQKVKPAILLAKGETAGKKKVVAKGITGGKKVRKGEEGGNIFGDIWSGIKDVANTGIHAAEAAAPFVPLLAAGETGGKKKAPSKWNEHVKRVAKKNKGLDFQQIIEIAKATYKK
jgi:hypothetical protein